MHSEPIETMPGFTALAQELNVNQPEFAAIARFVLDAALWTTGLPRPKKTILVITGKAMSGKSTCGAIIATLCPFIVHFDDEFRFGDQLGRRTYKGTLRKISWHQPVLLSGSFGIVRWILEDLERPDSLDLAAVTESVSTRDRVDMPDVKGGSLALSIHAARINLWRRVAYEMGITPPPSVTLKGLQE